MPLFEVSVSPAGQRPKRYRESNYAYYRDSARATSDRTTTTGCPIFATVSSWIRSVIFAAAKIPIL
jgi:hypothetical protein